MNDYTQDILLALKLAANFTTIEVDRHKAYGSWNQSSKIWSGAMGQVENGKADLIASLYLMTPKRFSSFDYTVPIKGFETSLIIRKPSTKLVISWTGYFMVREVKRGRLKNT